MKPVPDTANGAAGVAGVTDAAGVAGAAGPTRGWLPWLVVALLLLLGARVLMVIASGSGLHVDEAQYWVWSRDLQWGYYSKPPVIAALIRASTQLAGDGVVGIRLLCMLCWLAASAVLAWLGAQMLSVRAGLWAAALLAATPASGLLGLVATTDAPLLLGWTVCMALTWQALRVSSLPVPVISPNFEMLPDAGPQPGLAPKGEGSSAATSGSGFFSLSRWGRGRHQAAADGSLPGRGRHQAAADDSRPRWGLDNHQAVGDGALPRWCRAGKGTGGPALVAGVNLPGLPASPAATRGLNVQPSAPSAPSSKASHRPGRWALGWWALAGLALGGTLLAKYTALALLPSLAWVLWRGAIQTDGLEYPHPPSASGGGSKTDRQPGGKLPLGVAPQHVESAPLRRVFWPATGGSVRPRAWFLRLLGPAVAALAALLCLLPHLAWNASHHWPTLQHTLDITVRASQAPGAGLATPLKSLGEHLAGQLLLFGPGLWLLLWAALRHWSQVGQTGQSGSGQSGSGQSGSSQSGSGQSGIGQSGIGQSGIGQTGISQVGISQVGIGQTSQPVLAATAWRAPAGWALAFAVPLQLLALLQALKGGAQLNWSAPSLAGLCLAGGLWLAAHPQHGRSALRALLLSAALTALVAVSHDLRFWHSGARDGAYRPLDFWHKTRYWDVVLQQLDATRLAHPGRVVATVERDVLVQAAYAWRQQPPVLQAWRAGGPAKTHFELLSPLDTAAHDELLFLDVHPPPAALAAQYRSVVLLAQASRGRVSLGLWLLRRDAAVSQS